MFLRSMFKSAFLLLSGSMLYASPVITRDVSFTSTNTEISRAICVTHDNNFIVGGTSVDSTGAKKSLLIKVSSDGKQAGRLLLPARYDNEIIGITQAFDGGYVACGYYSSEIYGSDDWEIIKVDSTGNRIWVQELGFTGSDQPRSIVQTADSGFIVAGYSSGSSNDTAATLLKLNKNGSVAWYRLYTSDISVFHSVKQTSGGGFILTGSVRGTNAWHGGMDAFLFKVDSTGKAQWYKAHGGSGDEIGYSLDLTLDGGYVLAGSTTSYNNGLEDAFVMKTDSVGNGQWYKTFGGAGKDEALGVIQNGNNYYFTGNMQSFSADSVAMVYQLQSNGDSVWSTRLQGFVNQSGVSPQKIKNNLFTLCYSHVANSDTAIGVFISQTYTKVATGYGHSMFLKPDGTLWSCGWNSTGQLGDGTTINRNIPVQVMRNVQDIALGRHHSLILKTDGTLWSCGYNYYGQLGDGTTTDRQTPVQVMSNVKNMSAAESQHSLILKTDGTLWSCGYNHSGELGDGTNTNRTTPLQVMSNVKDNAAGESNSLILKTNGTLWSCGWNYFGQLGNETNTNRTTPVQVMSNVMDIAAGSTHSLILKTDGTLWSCGSNYFGQLGDGTTTDRRTYIQVMTDVQTMAAGYYHSLILKTDGTLWSCGYNYYGQLGNGTNTNRTTPVQVMSNVQYMAAGAHHSLILKTDGTLWSCGYNGSGQLADGTTTDRHTPVQIQLGN